MCGRNRLIATIVVYGLTIVASSDSLLVARRGPSQDMKYIVAHLQSLEAREHMEHLTFQRPWGRCTVLQETAGCKIKNIVVNPTRWLILQSDKFGSKIRIVTRGEATVTRDPQCITVATNESTSIPIGAKCRLENLGMEPLAVIEVQVGSFVGGDDIVRHEDHYGRTQPVSDGVS